MNPFKNIQTKQMKNRFRGFLPIVVDLETAGIDPQKNALLEMCIVLVEMDEDGRIYRGKSHFEHILPFEGAELDPESLAFTEIDPFQPLRFALEEHQALENLFKPIRETMKRYQCERSVLVGHNAWFDLLFLKAAAKRSEMKTPFHKFTCFDTASLSGLIYGQTVLAKCVRAAGLPFDPKEAHSAIYDAEKTADLFCMIMNTWKDACLKI